MSVNVFELNKEEKFKKPEHTVFPLKVTDEEKTDHFDLLLINNEEMQHFTYISNFSGFVQPLKTAHEDRVIFRKPCFTSFDNRSRIKLSGQAAIGQHKKICGEHKAILPVVPKPGTALKFEGWGETTSSHRYIR